MKNLFFYFTFIIGILFLNSCVKAESTAIMHNGRCTGSASCSACSNCSRCGHCSAGGSCGVCGGSSRGRSFTAIPKKSKRATPKRTVHSAPTSASTAGTKSAKYSAVTRSYSNTNEKMAAIRTSITALTNIRDLPSLDGKVIEQIKYGSKLMVLEHYGEWIKVEVKQSGIIGYVFKKNVK